MAGGLNSYRLLRKIHFVSSTFIFTFALLYIFSGMVMSKGNWFNHGGEQKTTNIFPLNYTPDTTHIKHFSQEIKQQFDISGRMTYVRNRKDELVFTYYRPMVRNVVRIHSGLDSLSIVKTEKITFIEANTRIHRVHGYHGGPAYVIWAILLDLTAISMIVFALTGFLIWFRMRKQLFYGWFLILPTLVLFIVLFLFLK